MRQRFSSLGDRTYNAQLQCTVSPGVIVEGLLLLPHLFHPLPHLGLSTFLKQLSMELYTFLYNLPVLVPHLLSTSHPTLLVPPSPIDALLTTLMAPLLLLDITLHSLVLLYILGFQISLYFVYFGVFIFSHIIGDYGRLEKTGRIVEEERTRMEERARMAEASSAAVVQSVLELLLEQVVAAASPELLLERMVDSAPAESLPEDTKVVKENSDESGYMTDEEESPAPASP